MNHLNIIANAYGAPLFSGMRKAFGFGDKLATRIIEYCTLPIPKGMERCAQVLPPLLRFRGAGSCNRLLGDLRISGFIGGGGVRFQTRTWKLAALAMLSGCSQLPLDGPTKQDIITGASTTLANPPHAVVYDYALVDINPVVLDCLADVETDSFSRTFGGRAPALRVGVGDVLAVSVFEASAGSPFAAPVGAAAGANRQSSFVTIPNLTVDSSGAISVPYAGGIQVAGRRLPEIEREIESKLANRVVEPQVVLNMAEQNAGSVTVVGDSGSNKVRLSGSGERILDVISKAGGFKYPAYETDVVLQRKKRVATAYLPTLVRNPDENIYVQPDDVIYVNRNQRHFVAAGAIGSSNGTTISGSTTLSSAVGLFSFDQEHLSLNEAIGKAGGLLDDRADPAQVFVYRAERRKTLEGIGVDSSRFPPNQPMIPTVYRANFRDPSSFLFAQRFWMRNQDTIYVGNSEATEVSKVFAYLNLWTSTASGVAIDANTVLYHGP